MTDVRTYYRGLMSILKKHEELKRTCKGLAIQGGITACLTFIGGVVGGRIGAAIGTTIGIPLAFFFTDPYNSMLKVLRNLNDEDRQTLVEDVCELVGDATLDALAGFIMSGTNKKRLIDLVMTFTNIVKNKY